MTMLISQIDRPYSILMSGVCASWAPFLPTRVGP